MKTKKQTQADPSMAVLQALAILSDYHNPMQVTELKVYRSAHNGEAGYYVCPRCKTTMECMFMSYCDRCGQKLGWEGYKKAKVIRLGGQNE